MQDEAEAPAVSSQEATGTGYATRWGSQGRGLAGTRLDRGRLMSWS